MARKVTQYQSVYLSKHKALGSVPKVGVGGTTGLRYDLMDQGHCTASFSVAMI